MSHKMGQIFEARDLDLWTSMKFIKTFSEQDDFFESDGTVEALTLTHDWGHFFYVIFEGHLQLQKISKPDTMHHLT